MKPIYPKYTEGVKPPRRRSGVNPVPTFYEFVDTYTYDRQNILAIALTLSEVQQLADTVIEDPKLANVRDVFVFSCLTGLRYSDVAQLKAINFRYETPIVIFNTASENTATSANRPAHGGDIPPLPPPRCAQSRLCGVAFEWTCP